MGVAESKLQLKSHFNELTTTSDIPESAQVWNFLLSTPVNSRELFSLVSARDVREVKETHPENLEMLLRVCINRIVHLTRLSAIGPSSEEPLLCGMRVLTRAMPLAYEGDTSWSIDFLWKSDLGKDLVGVIAKLFAYPGFTVEQDQQIWTQGVGSALDYRPGAKMLENRIELLRLTLAVMCQPLFSVDTPYALDYMVSCLPKPQAMSIFCTLFNTSLAHSRSIWNKPFQEEVVQTLQAKMSNLSQQLLLALVGHVNSEGRPNRFRKLLSKLHHEDDIKFVLDRLMVKVDGKVENVALAWECLQANHGLLEGVRGERGSELTKKLVDIFLDSSMAPNQELPRTASYLLLFLSSHEDIAASMADTIRLAVSPYNAHVDLILRILCNVSPFLTSLEPGSFAELVRYLRETVGQGTPKQCRLAVKLAKQCLSTLQEKGKPLAFGIAQATWPDTMEASWFVNYAEDVNSPAPASYAAVKLPELCSVEQYRPIKFEWSSDRLRWYASVVWGSIFKYDQEVFAPGIWSGTYIDLFKIEKVSLKPSLARPRGAVDAVADAVAEQAKSWIYK